MDSNQPPQQTSHQITPQNPPQTTPKEPKLTNKTLQAFDLVNNGLSPKQALQFTNLKSDISDAAVCKFNAKYRKYSLQHPSMVKAARNVVKDILLCKPNRDDVIPSHANQLAAASMVYDRYEPARQVIESTQQTTLNINVQEIRDRVMKSIQVVDVT